MRTRFNLSAKSERKLRKSSTSLSTHTLESLIMSLDRSSKLLERSLHSCSPRHAVRSKRCWKLKPTSFTKGKDCMKSFLRKSLIKSGQNLLRKARMSWLSELLLKALIMALFLSASWTNRKSKKKSRKKVMAAILTRCWSYMSLWCSMISEKYHTERTRELKSKHRLCWSRYMPIGVSFQSDSLTICTSA